MAWQTIWNVSKEHLPPAKIKTHQKTYGQSPTKSSRSPPLGPSSALRWRTPTRHHPRRLNGDVTPGDVAGAVTAWRCEEFTASLKHINEC